MDHQPQQQQQQQSHPQNLRHTFRNLKDHTSTLANFLLQWQDLEDHFLSVKTQLEYLEKTTKPSSIQSQNKNPETKIRDFKTKSSLQSQIQTPESEFQDFETESSDQSQNENPEAESTDNTIQPSKISSLPLGNGESLLLYFNVHLKQHDVLRSALSQAFIDMSKPGKLVLQALRFFYPSKSTKLDVSVTRRSCIVFLEELSRVECLVGDQEREEALEMALDWKAKMKNSLEVLGFLMLVAVFGLVDDFDKDETFKYFDNVAQRDQAPELFRAIGFEDKAHDFIKKLIDKKKRLEAVPFIYEFELVDEFPPVPLLRAHSEYAEGCYRKICDKGNNSSNALDNATGTQLAALRGILKLIGKYKLRSEYSPKIIRSRIQQLKKHKGEKRPAKISPTPVGQPQLQIGNKRIAVCEAQPSHHDTSKRTQSVVSTSPSTVSINTTTSSKPQSYYQEADMYRTEDGRYFSLSSGHTAAATSVTSASINTSPASFLVQSSHMLMPHLRSNQAAQHLVHSSGLHNYVGSSAFPANISLTDHPYGIGVSALSTLRTSSMARQYGSGSSIPVTHQFASTVGPYGSIASTSFRPPLNLLDLIYLTNVNGDTGQHGSAGIAYSNGRSL